MPGFNPLFIGACLRPDEIGLSRKQLEAFQSPLHRGMSSAYNDGQACQSWFLKFQSPLHRGMSSAMIKTSTPTYHIEFVSIPSSSGHVFGHQRRRGRQLPADGRVSIPSSSGHVFGQDNTKDIVTVVGGFNPLFIGACLRPGPWTAGSWWLTPTLVSIPSSSGHVFGLSKGQLDAVLKEGFNPLFIGACLRPRPQFNQPTGRCRFQSPLHRGMSSAEAKPLLLDVGGGQVSIPSSSGHVFGPGGGEDRLGAGRRGFNPLFIGACLRPRLTRRPRYLAGCSVVSIPSSSGHVFGH